uniref:wall-associated receptor kinase-like 1 n=1 Tax=Erigeron canadensis TaxID=72917 RepID=UPI001CB98382|nr:wall-associated receptor kinase-like 1 [Erigeron canadensis]
MKQFQVYQLLIMILLTIKSTVALKLTKKGCEEKCGEVGIPFPFGIGVSCSLDKRYNVDCNSSKPYLSAFDNVEVLNISLQQQTITVNVSMTFDCQNRVLNSSQILISTINPGSSVSSPFLFSSLHNIFVVEGCGNAVITEFGKTVTGCSTTCHNDTFIDRNNCYGMGCCQATVPYYLDQFTLNLTSLERSSADGTCGSAFLVDKDLFSNGNFYRHSIDGNLYFVPISLFWPITMDDIPSYERQECGQISYHDNSLEDSYIRCQCDVTHEGNPYLPNGCKKNEECKNCERNGHVCGSRPSISSDEETMELPVVLYCDVDRSSTHIPLGGILGVSASIGLFILVVFICSLNNIIKKTIDKRRRKKFFKRNGGLLLKQQETTDTGLVDRTILFTSKELDKATDHFSENRILGCGGQGTVYKGMLTDGRIIAIKKSKGVDESQIEQFINEVVILSQVNHRNVVKLLGCCLETEVPLLVSEFISNGTLYDLIQDESGEFPMSLNTRIQIAAEVAGALAYLHSATSIPIYHRDIKTTNILMDEKYRAKVSDFGTSRFVSIDQTHLTTLVKGTFGYLDPEYFQSSQFTEKSDVYSFGVVLLELLTREKPISLSRFGEHRNLATYFISGMEEGHVMSIFDPMVVNEGSSDELLAIANLAVRCLNPNGKNRPTMKEVASELEGMRIRRMPLPVQASIEHTNYSEELPLSAYDTSTSTTMSFKDSITE